MCSTCDCEGIQIPIGQQGAVGPQGPAGADGADGSNGTNGTNGTSVLINSYTLKTSTTNGVWESLEDYKFPANTFATNEAAVIVEAVFVKNTSTIDTASNTRLRLQQGSSTVLFNIYSNGIMTFGVNKIRMISRISRVSSSSVKVETKIYKITGREVTQVQDCDIVTITGLDFTTSDMEVEASCLSAEPGDVSLQSFFITKYLK